MRYIHTQDILDTSLFQLKNIGIQTIVNFEYSGHQVNAILIHILKVKNLMEEYAILLNTYVSFAEKIE